LIDQAGVKDVFKFGKSIGCEGPIAIVQLDTTPFFKHVWPIANVFVPRQNEFKIPQLPNADTMLNGITPRISASFKTENGYQLYQKSVIPNSTIPSTVGAFMGMFLAIIDVVE